MKFFLDFIKSRIVSLACIFSAAVIFAVVLSLYSLPLEPVLYALILSVTVIAVIGAFSFAGAYKKHKLLRKLTDEIIITADNLPKAVSNDDKDYGELIRILHSETVRLREKAVSDMRSTEEYYTMWVHQIKTPIAAMRIMLQTEDTVQSRRLSDELLRIEQYAEMALCYARLDSCDSDLVLKYHDLDEIVKKAVRRLSSQFIGKKLKLCYEPLCTKVLTDEKWLNFVIEQILSNAVKYTNSGSISIYMKQDTDRKILCIADTGIGIEPSDLPRIFENGYTGSNGRYDMRASGIGLYLCRRVADMLCFGISAQSELGKGSVFMLDLSESNIRHE
ncbi:MAG: sensor histidine kinase [Ruminiclostridium sp.]